MKEAGGADGEQGGGKQVLADGHDGDPPSPGCGAAAAEATPEQKAAIRRFLDDSSGAGVSRATRAMVWAALMFAATLLMVAGVGIAVGDGNEFDGVDCGVAAKPPGYSKGPASGQAGKADGQKFKGVGDGAASGPGGPPPPLDFGAVLMDLPSRCVDAASAVVKRVEAAMHRFEGKLDAVLSEVVDLRTAKKRLEGMLADGLFGFTQKVDARSFKVLCAILAEGDVAKASRALEMPDASVRTLMRRWRGMGKEYRAMADLVRWRKAVGRRETVSLNENVLLEKASRVDYPGLLADVLDGLLSMTQENWQDRCEELAELLRPVADG